MEKTIHQGRNIKRFREMLGIKQEALASELGEDWNQRKVSLLEQKDVVEPEVLDQVAKVLKVPVDAIRKFDEETAYNVIGKVVTNVNDNATGQIFQFSPTINPIDKWMEAIEEIKKLYERLLDSEKEKIELLKKIAGKWK